MVRIGMRSSNRAGFSGVPLLIGALVAFAVALACTLAPDQSFAYFNEVDDNYSAQQDIGAYGEPVAAADIPDGTYSIVAKTSSRMCVFYATANDAATRSDNKGHCVLSVAGGYMTATFYLSPAYTHIYMGSGAQAARLTNAAGTDDSAYVRGEAVPVSTSSGTVYAYRYTMAMPELNSLIAFASYDGGSRGVEGGKWYNREVVFIPNDEIVAAIAGRPSQPQDPGSGSDPDPAPDAGDGEDPGSGSATDGDGSGEGSDTDSGADADSGADSSADEQEGSKPAGTASSRRVSDGGQVGSAGQAAAGGEGGSGAGTQSMTAGSAVTSGKLRGKAIVPAVAGAPAFAGEAATVAVVNADAIDRLTPVIVMALVIAGLALAGVVARTLIFAAERTGKLK